ncbi:MAG: hypothetical protein KDB80_12090, partial [Planctomycetes bacterium]|nr:hypothetical protein [Planctomycetota bacterium]
MLLARLADAFETFHADCRAGVPDVTGFWNAFLRGAGVAEAPTADRAVAQLVDLAVARGGRIVLTCDHLDRALEALGDDAWAVRDVLSSQSEIALVGSSRALPPQVVEYESAFFDFFAVDRLAPLIEPRATEMLLAVARDVDSEVAGAFERHPKHTRAIVRLCGGNPRALVSTVEALIVHGTSIGVFECLDHVCDRLSPSFEMTLEAISPQARLVLSELALHWHPAWAKTIAARLSMPTNKISTYLDRLSRDGIVDKVAMPPGKTIGFQLRDRLCNLWFLLRGNPESRDRVRALTRHALGENDVDLDALRAGIEPGAPRERLAVELRDA